MIHVIKSEEAKSKLGGLTEKFLLVVLSVLPGIMFFTQRRRSVFDVLAIGALLAWRFVIGYRPQRTLPKPLVIITGLYVLSYLVGALISEHKEWPFPELSNFWFLLYAGLLFTAPLQDKYRKIIITFFFSAAAIAGIAGILQFYGFMSSQMGRPSGLSPHPILYAAMLAFVCGSAIIMLFLRVNNLYQSSIGLLFLLCTAILTGAGIIFSGSRGIWIAVVAACIITLFLYNRRVVITAIVFFLLLFLTSFFTSNYLRDRMVSTITSAFTEDSTGSTGTRFELWKGSILVFKKSPFLGIGIWDFEPDVKNLIHEGKLKKVANAFHAHNLFFQALSTRGIVGLTLTVLLLAAVLHWGRREILDRGGMGGYVIVLCAVLTIVGGLTEVTLELSKYLSACCYTIGLIGPYGLSNVHA